MIMSRSRLLRSQSTDDLLNRTLNSYSSSLAGDNAYRTSSFDYSDPLYSQNVGLQSRYDRRFSQYSGINEIDTNSYQRHPVKERRVTWAPILESSSARDRFPNSLERSRRPQTNVYRTSNSQCPIHGYEGHNIPTTEGPSRYNLDTRYYNSQANTSSLYEIRPSTRNTSSMYNSTLYGATEPGFPRDYLRSANGPCMIPHSYSSFSSIKNPFSNMGYYPCIGPKYHGAVNLARMSQSNLQKPKWRRSIIGLNRWGMYH